MLIWTVQLAKMHVDNLPKSSAEHKLEQRLEIADTLTTHLHLTITLRCKYLLNIVCRMLPNLVMAIIITFLMYIKILPFAIVLLTYSKHGIVITPDMLSSMRA
jgi:hypothetical protein